MGCRVYAVPLHITVKPRVGERDSSDEKRFLAGQSVWQSRPSGVLSRIFSMCIISFLVPSVLSVVAVTVDFLVSLLFPVNCPYFNL